MLVGMKQLVILVLAAGQSRRMGGRDKLLEQVDAMPLLRRTVTMAAEVAPVIVALPPPPHPRYACLQDLDITRVAVPDATDGMNASLRRALASVPTNAQAAMILLADLPDLTAQDLKKVAQATVNGSFNVWRGVTEDGLPGHPVVLDRSLFSDVMALSGDSGAQSVIRQHAEKTCLVRLPGQAARTDLDTPEAWASWRISHPNR